MNQGWSTAHVSVLIEEEGKAPRYVTWKGSNKRSIMSAARRAYPGARLEFGNVWYTTSYGAHENPLASSTTELVVGGVASVALIGLGVTMIYQALNPSGASTSDTLQNTAALAALAGVV